jgi:hypothetical protein
LLPFAAHLVDFDRGFAEAALHRRFLFLGVDLVRNDVALRRPFTFNLSSVLAARRTDGVAAADRASG